MQGRTLDQVRSRSCGQTLKEKALMSWTHGPGRARKGEGAPLVSSWLVAAHGCLDPFRSGTDGQAAETLWRVLVSSRRGKN